jgi:hypothetical protein
MFDGLHAKCRGDVRFAGARTTDQDNIVDGLNKVTTVQLLTRASLTSLLEKSKPARSR